MLRRLWEAFDWRYRIVVRDSARRRYLRRTFVNGDQLARSYRSGVPCDEAVCRDGLVIRHPSGRTALAQMLVEVWFNEVYTRGFYAPSSGDVIVDAGANIGLFSIWAARRCPACHILAFEPFPENYDSLIRNLSAAEAGNVKAMLAAVSAESGLASMVNVGERSQDHRLSLAIDTDRAAVRTYSLADTLAMADASGIALFKCDIEGSEYDLFAGADQALLRRVLRFAVEYHDNIRPGTLALLRQRLSDTHSLRVQEEGQTGYGMLYATLKGLS